MGGHFAGVEHSVSTTVRQLRWRAPGGLPRSIPIRGGRLNRRSCNAGFAGANSDSARRGIAKGRARVEVQTMATTVHEPPRIEEIRNPSRLTSGSGGGGWRNLVPADGDLHAVQDYAPPPASTGIWVALAAISMSFAALTSALVVRKGGAMDWRHFTLPPILYLNTLVLLASSVTLEISRRPGPALWVA